MASFDHVIIAGSGPVGSFMAVLCKLLGFPVTVYEKREERSRNINLKIEKSFFLEVQSSISQLTLAGTFFKNLDQKLEAKNNRITIKELEETLIKEAKSLGVKYVIKEVRSFRELNREHKDTNPIILDCAGRNSKLRISEFGDDRDNMFVVPLQHAIYINFKAKVNDNLSLYQAMKYIEDVKLAEVVVGKEKNKKGYVNVTIPAFITDEFSRLFEQECPNTNREPLNPFGELGKVSERIFFVLSSLCGNLITDDWSIDLDSVRVKKIDIQCGYAKRRSYDSYVSMGDSAVHLAFFKSLNLGLRHGLDLFVKLAMHRGKTDHSRYLTFDAIMTQFELDNPSLNPIAIHRTERRDVFLVVTKIIRLGCYSYCWTSRKTEKLTSVLGVSESEVPRLLRELNNKLTMWSYSLEEFEAKRDEDIRNNIKDNEVKNVMYNYLSWFVNINGMSVVKINELKRAVEGKYALYRKDFEFLAKCFESRTMARSSFSGSIDEAFLSVVRHLLRQCDDEISVDIFRLKQKCHSDASDEEKIRFISEIVYLGVRAKKNIKLSFQKLSVAPMDSSEIILKFIRNELDQIREYNQKAQELEMLMPDLTIDD